MIKIKLEIKNNKSLAYDNNIVVGECEFINEEGIWNIIYTEVNRAYQGQGIAKKLVEIILEEAKKSNKKVIAECSYANKLLK